ncbi:metallophosphoesterase, partial [Pseudofrankia asymbiotica]|uniref:metallophosphoesterase n=1 Tax=Pseudofrankia asymbiotica TaxID=1834516 RepID=UPI003B75B5A2
TFQHTATTQNRNPTTRPSDPRPGETDIKPLPLTCYINRRNTLSHTPEPRVLDAFTTDGVQLTLSGHTHGGQIRLPFVGALVTNCGLDRGRARGLSRWHVAPETGTIRSSWLHVSAGLGTSPFAPIRLGCRPEATLLTLTPAS